MKILPEIPVTNPVTVLEEEFVKRIERRKLEAKTGEMLTSDELLARFERRMEAKFKNAKS